MRENEPVLFVLSVCDGEIILEKGEILSEKRHWPRIFSIFVVSTYKDKSYAFWDGETDRFVFAASHFNVVPVYGKESRLRHIDESGAFKTTFSIEDLKIFCTVFTGIIKVFFVSEGSLFDA